MNKLTGIQRAVSKFGSPAKLAAQLQDRQVRRQHVEHWLKSGRVSPDHAPEVASISGVPIGELNDRVNWSLASDCIGKQKEQAHAA